MIRRAALLLCCLGAAGQERPWLRDNLADRYTGTPFPDPPIFGIAPRTETRPGQATVLISEAAPAWERFQTFHLDLVRDLRQRLLLPPPSFHQVELTDFMLSDPSHPERLDLQQAIHALTPPSPPAGMR